MLQLFISFPEFAELAEFNESSAPSRKNSIVNLLWCRKAYLVYFLNVCVLRICGNRSNKAICFVAHSSHLGPLSFI